MILKEILETKEVIDTSDEATVVGANKKLLQSCRMSIMFSLPKDQEASSSGDAFQDSVTAMNNLLEPLLNVIPSVRVGPWLSSPVEIQRKELLKKLPANVNTIEKYVYDYSHFLSFGQRGYCRLQLFFLSSVTTEQISHCTEKHQIVRVQHFKVANSDAPYPIPVCTLTGSVTEIVST